MAHALNPLTFPLNSSSLMEASAGTGKTYTIAALYLRLVLGHGDGAGFGRPLTPPEILVVTFTNAATEELRHRIRQRLSQAAAVFRGLESGDDFLLALRDTYAPEALPARARLLEQAAQWMDESAIHTIHAWSKRMLRQHAMDSGCLFDMELAASDLELMEDAACDYWRRHLYPLDPGTLSEFLSSVKVRTPQDLLAKVRPWFQAGMETPEDPFDMLARQSQAIDRARNAWMTDPETPLGLIRKARQDKTLNGNKYREASVDRWADQIRAWVSDNGSLPEPAALEKFSAAGLALGTSKTKPTPVHPAFEALDRLNQTLADMDTVPAIMAHAARTIQDLVEQEKQRLAKVNFDDLLVRLGHALEGPGGGNLAAIIRNQFPVAMVDEFQDTDPIQYQSFRRIYLDQPGTGFFMIGDPKQAIYSFRGADIHTYLTARRDTLDRQYTLDTNYRSVPGMVNAVNRMFSAASDYPGGAFLFEGEIPFDPVQAGSSERPLLVDGQLPPPMTLWHLDQSAPLSKGGPDGYLRQTARATAGEIARLLALSRVTLSRTGFQLPDGTVEPLRPSDIAILVRSGNEAAIIRAELEQRFIKSVYLSDRNSVFESSQARDLAYLLRACSDPSRENWLRAALATGTMGLSITRLDRLNQDEDAWETVVEQFRTYQTLWQHQGVLPMVRRLLRDFQVPARLLAAPRGERALTNLLHLAELLQGAAMNLDGEQALLRWLAQQMDARASASDDTLVRLETDDALVRVVTIHKSKGLEYPLVFLPFASTATRVDPGKGPLKLRDSQGQVRFVHMPDESDLEQADTQRLAEDIRLLYVGLTRARQACWVGVGVIGRQLKTGEKSESHLSGMGYLISGGIPVPAGALPEKLMELKGGCPDISVCPLPMPEQDMTVPEDLSAGQALLTTARTFTGVIPSSWFITSYSGLLSGAGSDLSPVLSQASTATEALPDTAAEDQLMEIPDDSPTGPELPVQSRSIHGFPRGPEPGTFLHDILEWAATKGFGTISAPPGLLGETLKVLCARRGWDDWALTLTDWLSRLVTTPLPLPGTRLMLARLDRTSCQAEMEFLFAAHAVDTRQLDAAVTESILPGKPRPGLRPHTVNGMLKGFIDLVFCHQGRYWVLDYKSNVLGDNNGAYTREAMADAMLDHRYDLQYALYILALHRLLKHRLPGYRYQEHMGGAVYLFLRGVSERGTGVYTDTPPETLINRLDRMFAHKEIDHDA